MPDHYVTKICRRCGIRFSLNNRRDRRQHVICSCCRFTLPESEAEEYAAAIAA